VDKIIKYEELQKSIYELFGIKKLPKLNSSKHEYYTTYYNAELKNMVYDIYYKDIELFNYTFINPKHENKL